MFQGPGQHLPHHGVLGIQPPDGGHLPGGGLQSRRRLLRHPQRIPGQQGGRLVLLPGLSQQPGAEDPQRLQHHVPGTAIRIRPRRAQQRAVHQMQHRRAGAGPGDRLGGLQRERPREHRHRAEHPPLRLTQQLVTPLHGGLQRPLPRRRQPVPPGQQRQPVTNPVQQLRHPERLDPRRRQLDRQRHPVQPRHQPRHHRPGRAAQREPRVHLPGPVGEQRHRRRSPEVRITRARHRQRRQPVPGLPGDPQRLATSRQHPHIISGRQQPGAQPGGRPDHVLAIVQHQQQLLAGEHPRQRLNSGNPRLIPYPQRRRHHRGHQRRIPHRRQLRQPHPVREPARHPPRHHPGQPGLPRTARPGHRHQPPLTQQPGDRAHRLFPADEARQHHREAMHATPGTSRNGPLHARTLTAGPPGVQPAGPQEQAVPHQPGRRSRPPAMPRGWSGSHQPPAAAAYQPPPKPCPHDKPQAPQPCLQAGRCSSCPPNK